MNRPRVLLADDHAMLLDGLIKLLETRCEVIASVTDGDALIKQALALQPDIVVSDISMPGVTGFDAARRLLKDLPGIKIILLTMNEDPDMAAEALRMGVSAYVLKSAASTELFTAIDAALTGRTHVSGAIMGETLNRLSGPPPKPSAISELTPRQLEVLRHLAGGHSMKEVAAILHIAPRTVAFHKYRMMEVLGVDTSADLIRYAIKHGIIVS